MNDEVRPMQFAQTVGRYMRLGRELLCARASDPHHLALIERLEADLIDAQDTIAAYRPIDEQCGDSLLSYANVVLMPSMDEARRVEHRAASEPGGPRPQP